ncbi:MAG: choice-of-anchor J domain-containing protein, partial [bacterium]
NAQIKINEGFEGTQFPPEGWSVSFLTAGGGIWNQSIRNQFSGSKCAVSNFESGYSSNYLISRRFVPASGDSLVFSFKQTFWNNYKDTFNIYISTTDSLYTSMSTRLFNFIDSVSYPSPLNYGRYSISLNAYAGQTVWVGFRHINFDGDNIRLDDVSVGHPVLNEVGVLENLFPNGNFNACAFQNIIPKAKIRNFGSINQTIPFNTTYSVTGPSSYVSVRADTLSAGNDKTIYFDTMHISAQGTYNVKIFTSLPGDENISNDTLYSTFTIINTNFGGGLASNGGYFFSNSASCSLTTPGKPQFCWKDTTGSTNLIFNRSNATNGLLTGNIDNGYFSLGNILPAMHKIKFFNSEYDSVFITTNGIIGFKKNDILLSADAANFSNLLSQQVPAFAPFWSDLDFGNTTSDSNRLSYKISGNQLIITYDRVNLKSGDAFDYLSFQVSIEFGDSLTNNSKILVQYNKETSGINFISSYLNNTLPPNLIGMKNISGSNSLIYRYRDSINVTVDGPLFDQSLALEFGVIQSSLNNKCSQLNLSVKLQAISPARDTVQVSLRDSKNSFRVLESQKVYLDSTGSALCNLTIPDPGYKYYIEIKHKNSIETWSRLGGEDFNSYALEYNFSNNINMAFGNNMILKNGLAHIYTGDINQDGSVNGLDVTDVYNSLILFTTGYLLADLDNDQMVTLHDMLYCYNNNIKFVHVYSP